MTGHFSLGGADIYVTDSVKWKVLPKEGDLNVVEYNGMIIKYPEQNGVKANASKLTPCIFTENGRTAIRLEKPVVNGSPNDDKVNSYCVGGIFNFKGGGKDDIKHFVPNDSNYDDKYRKCKFNINENDVVTERYYNAVMDVRGKFGDKILTLTNKNDKPSNDITKRIVWDEAEPEVYDNSDADYDDYDFDDGNFGY